MTGDEARAVVTTVIHQVAPEADLASLGSDEPFAEALDLDSMDFLNVMIGIAERTGVEVPERDYPEVATLDHLVGYVAAAAGTGGKR